MEEFERRRVMLTMRGMVQPSHQHVASCVKVVERGLGMTSLRMVAAFWAGISAQVTEEVGVVPRYRYAAIRTPF